MNIGERIALIREKENLNQESFGKRINVTRSAISNYEKGTRNVMDRVIYDICREFNVNEEWLRNGTGEMLIECETFSLDEYAKANKLSELEFDIIKSYISLDVETRNKVMSHFKDVFAKHSKDEIAATKELSTEEFTGGCKPVPHVKESKESKELYIDDSIKAEVEAFTAELMATKKGQTSSALEQQDENLA